MIMERTDKDFIKSLEELNKQAPIFNNVKSTQITYIGIYELLDEIIKRLKEVKLFDIVYVDKYADIFIKVYKELKESDNNGKDEF